MVPHHPVPAQPAASASMPKMRYRLALDLGTTSIGWAMMRLNADDAPCAVIRAGVRIFSDGRDPKSKASLAVDRRLARGMRRRRDRLLRRKQRMMRLLIEYGFFPTDDSARKQLEQLNPYELRARGLDHPLSGPEFARALFHLNQRRGFRSNRKTDKAEAQVGPLKKAIAETRLALTSSKETAAPRTVGEWLWRRICDGQPVRARYRERRVPKADGKTKIDKSYDLYIDRAMVESEFDQLWAAQSVSKPDLYTEAARHALKNTLLYQRPLKPVRPGRCTFLPTEDRAPLALPSTQRFRIYQEINNLRILDHMLMERSLTVSERDLVVAELEQRPKLTFAAIKRLLRVPGDTRFNLEGPKREDLKGNGTSVALTRGGFGDRWGALSLAEQDEVVHHLLEDESEAELIAWLRDAHGLDGDAAAQVAALSLPEGYGRVSAEALKRLLPPLQEAVIPMAQAAAIAGFHHSQLDAVSSDLSQTFEVETVSLDTGEVRSWRICHRLPYYGEVLQRHVAFGSGEPNDPPERRFGKIANPTVHIGLNQLRVLVNALIARYGHPHQVVLEVARDLKAGRKEREAAEQAQADNQKRNARLRTLAAQVLTSEESQVQRADLQKLILWEELHADPLERRCPYTGERISIEMLLSDAVEVEHILPFSRTLDDSLQNKTVALRKANRVKGNRTPWEARADFEAQGWAYADIVARASAMATGKRYRFAEEGYATWLKQDKDFLARALNDTRYLSRVAREYVQLVCPMATWVIPGRMTALLRGRFGLNDILGVRGEKNRNDHRHHAVDACVIGVTDRGLLQRFAQANASARERQLNRLVDNMPLPWPTYRDHVSRAVSHVQVSHRPDHSHESQMHNDTAYGLRPGGRVVTHAVVDGRKVRQESTLAVIPMTEASQARRHGVLQDGSPRPYKGYKGDSNYCIEIVRTEDGGWQGEVISTFEAYQAVKKAGDATVLRQPTRSLSGRPLVMRLMRHDCIRLVLDGQVQTMRVVKLSISGVITLAPPHEANVDARSRDSADEFGYTSKTAGSLQRARARQVHVSPSGEVHDPGWRP